MRRGLTCLLYLGMGTHERSNCISGFQSHRFCFSRRSFGVPVCSPAGTSTSKTVPPAVIRAKDSLRTRCAPSADAGPGKALRWCDTTCRDVARHEHAPLSILPPMTDPGSSTLSAMPLARRSFTHHILLIAVASLVFFTNLGRMRLMDRDEPRNAGCAAEMLARHDWVVPTFNAELRTHKPVLTYWFMMTAYSVFGVNEFGARFWSAILGIGTVLMTYHIGRRLFNPTVGLWAGLVTSTSLWFAIAARIATPDSIFVFFSTLPIFIYVLA